MPPSEGIEAEQSTSIISVTEIHGDTADDTLDESPLEKLSATIFETVQQARAVIAVKESSIERPRFAALRPGNSPSVQQSVNRQRLDEAILASDRGFRAIGSQVQMLLYSASFLDREASALAENSDHLQNMNQYAKLGSSVR